MISRMEFANKIAYTRNELKFPRIKVMQHKAKKNILLPSDQQIADAMNRARHDALEISRKFGMDFHEEDITDFDTSFLTPNAEASAEEDSIIEEDESWDFDDPFVLEQFFDVESNEPSQSENPGVSTNQDSVSNLQQEVNIEAKSHAESNSQHNIAEKRNFLETIHPDGTITYTRVSTFVWKLQENKVKLSSDRLTRVRGVSHSSELGSEPHRKKQKGTNVPSSIEHGEEYLLVKGAEIEVGEWAIFEIADGHSNNRQNTKEYFENNCLYGLVLGFKKIGVNGKMIQCKFRHAKTPFGREYNANLQVLAAWYKCDESGSLTPVENKKKIEMFMQNYISTITKVLTKVENAEGNPKLTYGIPCEFSKLSALILDTPRDTLCE